jgi:hypothetical protein
MTEIPVWLFGDWLTRTYFEFGIWILEFGMRPLGIKSVINGQKRWKFGVG